MVNEESVRKERSIVACKANLIIKILQNEVIKCLFFLKDRL